MNEIKMNKHHHNNYSIQLTTRTKQNQNAGKSESLVWRQRYFFISMQWFDTNLREVWERECERVGRFVRADVDVAVTQTHQDASKILMGFLSHPNLITTVTLGPVSRSTSLVITNVSQSPSGRLVCEVSSVGDQSRQ